MKIFIDDFTFNEAIKHGKLEVAEWLLLNNCPVRSSAYLQKLEIPTIEWLYNHNVKLEKFLLSNVIESTNSEEVIRWFIDRGVPVTTECVNSCIRTKEQDYTRKFILEHKAKLSYSNYELAVLLENIEMLDLLKDLNCPFEDSVIEKALKYSKKKSIKWLVDSGFLT
jgi:hypothetical protein